MIHEPFDVVLTFSSETLADAQRRGMMRPPDRLLQTLLQRPDVRGVVVADSYRSYLSPPRRLPTALSLARDRPVEHVRPRRWRRREVQDVAHAERSYRRYDRALAAAALRVGAVDPLVITCNPLVAAFADLTWSSNVVYYARDDWTSSDPHRELWPVYGAAYRRIAARGRGVVAVTAALLDVIGAAGGLVLPNGVAPGEWTSGTPEEWDQILAATPLGTVPRPWLSYVGTLDTRIDVDAVDAVARAFPAVSIVLAGPVVDATHLRPLCARGNIHFVGNLRRPDVVALLRSSRACILPHRVTPLTRSMSPLKLYEYLAAGRPVLAVDLPPVRGVGPGVWLCRTPCEYVGAAASALESAPLDEGERLAFVAANSWRRRHEALLRWAVRCPDEHAQ